MATPYSSSRGQRRPRLPPSPKSGRFERLRELGVGGMGVVFEAFDRKQDRRIAVKTLTQLEGERLLGLKREFRRLRDILHPNLVRLGELIEDDGHWCFTMERIEGVPVLDYLRGTAPAAALAGDSHDQATRAMPSRHASATVTRDASGITNSAGGAGARERVHAPADEARIRPVFAQLIAAVDALHAEGIVHCDLKSSNILVDGTGRVVVLDFGISRLVGEGAGTSVAGTPRYMAPEQITGRAVGPPADWYAVGSLLYGALTGQLPFGGDLEDLLARKRSGARPDPRELVIGLPADLAELCVELLEPEADRRAGAARAAAVFPGAPPTHGVTTPAALFVGRALELAALEHAYAAVVAGGSISVVLEGASGIGKSATLRAFLDQLASRAPAPLVLTGRCHERESVPYKAFDAVVDQLAGALARHDPPLEHGLGAAELAAMRAVFPVLADVLDAPEAADPAPDTNPTEWRDQAFGALTSVLRGVARARPVVVTIDDLHWADADSLALLDELTAARPALPWLLAVTARPNLDGGSCHAITHIHGDCRNLAIAPLAEREARELARRILAARDPSLGASAEIDAVIDESAGHPMFIDALLRHAGPLAARGRPSLDAALCVRVDGLRPELRGLLELIVAAGAPIPSPSLRAASALDPQAYAAALDYLVATRLARATDAVEPYHDRIREALYARLPDHTRRSLHDRVASGLIATDAGPDVLVRHLVESGRYDEAATQAVHAADAALAALAFERAADHLQIVLDHGPQDPATRRGVLERRAHALAKAGHRLRAGELFLAAADTEGTPEAARRELRHHAAEQFMQGGHLERGLAVTRRLLAEVGLPQSMSRWSAVLGTLWRTFRLSRVKLEWTPVSVEQLSDVQRLRIDTSWSLSSGLAMLDSTFGLSIQLLNAQLAVAAGEPERIARGLGMGAVCPAALGHTAGYENLIGAAAVAAEQAGSDTARAYVHIGRGMGAGWLRDDWRECLEHMESAAEIWNAAAPGDAWELDAIDYQQFAAHVYLGDSRVIEDTTAAIRRAKRRGNRFVEINLRCSVWLRWTLADDPDGGERDVREAQLGWLPGVRGFTNVDFVALRTLTELSMYRRPRDPAQLGALARGWRRYDRSLLRSIALLDTDATCGRVQLELCQAELTGGRQRRRHLRRAARLRKRLDRIRHPAAALCGTVLDGWRAVLDGDTERARALYAEAEAEAERRARRHLQAHARACLALLERDDATADPRVTAALQYWRERGAARPDRCLAHGMPIALATRVLRADD